MHYGSNIQDDYSFLDLTGLEDGDTIFYCKEKHYQRSEIGVNECPVCGSSTFYFVRVDEELRKLNRSRSGDT